jgi:hypothetical protein
MSNDTQVFTIPLPSRDTSSKIPRNPGQEDAVPENSLHGDRRHAAAFLLKALGKKRSRIFSVILVGRARSWNVVGDLRSTDTKLVLLRVQFAEKFYLGQGVRRQN